MNDPIDRIQWVHANTLHANDYNPNMVHEPELRLLERSILQTGWIQPVLTDADSQIIDGFHRWMLSRTSQAMRERYGGLLPVCRLEVSGAEARLMTIRINRAKGTHVAFRMAAVVKQLIDTYALDPEQIARDIGATRAEIDLLYQDNIFAARNIKDHRYSEAWAPAIKADVPAGSSLPAKAPVKPASKAVPQKKPIKKH